MKLHIIVSQVKDGNMSYQYGSKSEVDRNRALFFNRLNINQNKTVKLKLIHQNKIELLWNKVEKKQIEADAIITNVLDQTFYLCFGDCIPFIVWDYQNEILAFGHLGWIDINNNLHLEVIERMKKEFSSKVENLEIILGPSIKKESYVFKTLTKNFNNTWDSYITKEVDGYHVDINQKVIDDLETIGIQTIQNSNIDTGKDPNYFSNHQSSYFQAKENGRFIYGVYLSKY